MATRLGSGNGQSGTRRSASQKEMFRYWKARDLWELDCPTSQIPVRVSFEPHLSRLGQRGGVSGRER